MPGDRQPRKDKLMPTYLEQIMAATFLRVEDRRTRADLQALERRAAAHTPRGFAASLRSKAASGPAMIAECKKASPSKGVLREDYRPDSIAAGFERAGAAAISVLTDEQFFCGSLADLAAVSAAVKIPVLRKDFILDRFQILEARAAGADAILLIVAAHGDAALKDFQAAARETGLDVLCEVHDRDELDRAVGLGFEVIGVNSRNLKTLVVSQQTQMDLVQWLPANVLRVAESGVRTPEDVERLLRVGYDCFLVGEALMRQPDPAAALALLSGAEYDPAR